MTTTETKTRSSDNTITRRKMLQSVTATAITTVSAQAYGLSPSDIENWAADVDANGANLGAMAQLIDVHRAARQSADEISGRYDAVLASAKLPEARVVTGVDHFSKEPCRWAYSEGDVDRQVQERGQIPFGGQVALDAYAVWGERKKAELRVIEAERERLESEYGLDALYAELDEKENTEFDAFSRFIESPASSLEELRVKGGYLRELLKSDRRRLEGWVEELIGSFG